MFRYLLILAALISAACTQPQPKPEPAPAEPAPAEKPAPEVVKPPEAKKEVPLPPERLNLTPFSDVLVNGRCRGEECVSMGEYYSWQTKITFTFDAKGELKLAKEQERSLDLRDDTARDLKCGAKGGTGNQRTPWFPHTGVFVNGGRLLSVRSPEGARLPMLPLSSNEQGLMLATGSKARKVEYGYVPCVGKTQVTEGHRLAGYLPRGAVLGIKSARGAVMRLTLPQPLDPYAMLYYQNGAVIPVPMRPVMMTIDLAESRVVLYFQSTFATSPPLRKMELRTVLPNELPYEGEPQEQFVARINATLQHLRRCPVNTRPMEVCANPNQTPDPRIFAQPKVAEADAGAKTDRSGKQ